MNMTTVKCLLANDYDHDTSHETYFHACQQNYYSLWSLVLATLFLNCFCATHIEHVDFVLGLGWRFQSIIL